MNSATLNWIVFIALILATIFSHYWVWGLLFVYWSISAISDTNTRLLLPVSKYEQPLLFWAVGVLWLIFGLWYFFFDVLWRVGIVNPFGFNIYQGY